MNVPYPHGAPAPSFIPVHAVADRVSHPTELGAAIIGAAIIVLVWAMWSAAKHYRRKAR